MSKKIPELLECSDEIVITDEVRRLFDPEEIKELTMNKINQNERQTRRTRKPIAVILAAVLAAVALTATAFAAYQFIIAKQFDGYFGDLTEQQEKVMDQIGTSELSASTANGTTLTPLAVIGDSRHCYLRLRLEAPDDTQFPVTVEELKCLHIFGSTLDERYSLVDENGEPLSITAGEIEWIDSVPGDNVLDFIVLFSSDMSQPVHFNDGTAKILTIKGLWLEGHDKEYTRVLDGPWSFNIGFYGVAKERPLDVDGLNVNRLFNGIEYEDEGMSMTLRSMSISPLALTYAYDFTSSDARLIPSPGTIHIVMKDGSIAETIDGQGVWTDSDRTQEMIIQAPIDLEEVAYIQFGNQQIKIS